MVPGIFLSQYQLQTWVGAVHPRRQCFFKIQFSHFATSRSGDHPQEDLAKSDYKTNIEVEI
jgi:hypothetical protein